MAAAVVLGKRSGALAAARRAQVANAEYIRHFLDAHVKGDASAATWLARTPEANGFAAADVTIARLAARTPAPSAREFMAMIRGSGIQRALEQFHSARRADPDAPLFREATINGLGYQLLRGARPVDAIELFRVNVELFPQSANVYDSLAEAYMAHGDRDLAIANYKKSLELNPQNANGAEMLKRIEAPPAKTDTTALDKYAGTYELAPGFDIVITREGDTLFAEPTGQPKAELVADSTTDFHPIVAMRIRITFAPDGSSLTLHQGGRDVPGKRVK
jgi:tetratricopeptide (TPR) repeat protein